MNTTERAKEIRKALKEHGWNARKVSVRSDYFSMGSEIRVVIKDPAVDLETVEKIANEHESISRCEITGEILSGGNRYVSVRYSEEALESRKAPHRDAVQAAADKTDPSSNELHKVEGTDFLVGRDNHLLTLWHNDSSGCVGRGWDVEALLCIIAEGKVQTIC